ncbi:hypothetical protein BDW22DRAFT_215876 [Trametopsis cervina]|nr:hypothetical protein BDW22DRAFT_215876 [Trametopsis cervina]
MHLPYVRFVRFEVPVLSLFVFPVGFPCADIQGRRRYQASRAGKSRPLENGQVCTSTLDRRVLPAEQVNRATLSRDNGPCACVFLNLLDLNRKQMCNIRQHIHPVVVGVLAAGRPSMFVIQYYCTQLRRSWVSGQEDRRQMWSKSELGETVSGSGRATCDAISIETDALLLHHRLSHRPRHRPRRRRRRSRQRAQIGAGYGMHSTLAVPHRPARKPLHQSCELIFKYITH